MQTKFCLIFTFVLVCCLLCLNAQDSSDNFVEEEEEKKGETQVEQIAHSEGEKKHKFAHFIGLSQEEENKLYGELSLEEKKEWNFWKMKQLLVSDGFLDLPEGMDEPVLDDAAKDVPESHYEEQMRLGFITAKRQTILSGSKNWRKPKMIGGQIWMLPGDPIPEDQYNIMQEDLRKDRNKIDKKYKKGLHKLFDLQEKIDQIKEELNQLKEIDQA